MSKFKEEDFTIGEYYHIKEGGNKYYWIIQVIKIKKESIYTNGYISSDGSFSKGDDISFCYIADIDHFQLASPIEIKWLEECKKQGKFVPLEEIEETIENFPIY